MVHLSSQESISLMVMFSILTYFLGPLVTRNFIGEHPDQCIFGYLFGFTISVFIWMKYGRKL